MPEFKVFTGRPETGSRSENEEKSYDLLDCLGIIFSRLDHEKAASMEDLSPTGQALGCPIAKNLFLTNRQQNQFYLLIMPGDKPFKTKYLSAQLGCSRLSFASEEHLEANLGVKSGCASILALINADKELVRLVIDKDILARDNFACHPCQNTSSLAFATDDLNNKLIPALGFRPSVVELPWESE